MNETVNTIIQAIKDIAPHTVAYEKAEAFYGIFALVGAFTVFLMITIALFWAGLSLTDDHHAEAAWIAATLSASVLAITFVVAVGTLPTMLATYHNPEGAVAMKIIDRAKR